MNNNLDPRLAQEPPVEEKKIFCPPTHMKLETTDRDTGVVTTYIVPINSVYMSRDSRGSASLRVPDIDLSINFSRAPETFDREADKLVNGRVVMMKG